MLKATLKLYSPLKSTLERGKKYVVEEKSLTESLTVICQIVVQSYYYQFCKLNNWYK